MTPTSATLKDYDHQLLASEHVTTGLNHQVQPQVRQDAVEPSSHDQVLDFLQSYLTCYKEQAVFRELGGWLTLKVKAQSGRQSCEKTL